MKMPGRPNPRIVALYGLITGIFFLLGFLGATQLPKVRSLIAVKIEKISREHLPVRILTGPVDLSFFPLGATLSNVNVMAKDETADYLEGASFKHIRIAISPWQLLRGRLRLTEVEVQGAELGLKVPARKEKSSGPPLEGLFELLSQIPINRLDLDDINARIGLADPLLNLVITDLKLNAAKIKGNALALNIASGSLQVLKPKAESGAPPRRLDAKKPTQYALKADLDTDLVLTRDSIKLSSLNIRRGDSHISSEGQLNGDVEALDFGDLNLKFKTDLNLESIGQWVNKSLPVFMGALLPSQQAATLPALKGSAQIAGEIRREGHQEFIAEADLHADGLTIDKFFVDRVSTRAKFSHSDEGPDLTMARLSIDNPAGTIDLNDIKINLPESSHERATGNTGGTQSAPFLNATLNAKSVQLNELMKSLGSGEVPVWMKLSTDIPCEVRLEPDFNLSCQGKASAENLLVRAAMTSKGTIVAIRSFDMLGSFTVDKQKAIYTTEISMPNSKGRSSGTIRYDQGFKIAFEGDRFSFKDVANLGDLRLEGSTKIKGSTEGDSQAATFALDFDGSDLWLEDFWLGNAKAQIAYKSGFLNFSNLRGYYSLSRYSGDLKLDFSKNELALAMRSPFFDVREILKVFSRQAKIPLVASGTGQAQIKASGPLALNRMTYELKTSVFRGNLAGETFDQLNFDLKSNGGEVNAERVQLIKGSSTIGLTGKGHPDGTIDMLLKGIGLRLEDSNMISNSGLSLSGQLDFEMDLKGPVLSPNTDFRGRLTKTSVGDLGIPDSTAHLIFGSKAVKGEAQLLGGVIDSAFTLPLANSSPFALKLTAKDWNYAPLFAAIAGPASRKDYDGKLTTSIDLSSPSGGFWNSSGQINIDNFQLARGPLALRTSSPAEIHLKNGQFHIERFDLVGGNEMFLKVSDSAKPTSKLDLQASGKIDMTLLGLLTPFLEDLRGLLSFSINLRGGPSQSDLLGSAYLDKGFVKLFDFPHAFEDIRIDLLFSQKKILLNTIKASLGGGRMNATGSVEMKGDKNYPINIAGQFEKIALNVPDKVRTSGSGNVSFTGSWFPFILKIDYLVSEGLWTKEFGGDDQGDSDSIRRDQFLPDLLLQERFTPVMLDLTIDFNRGVQIKNELVDAHVSGQVAVKGSPAKPSVMGTVTMQNDSKIMVKDTVFDVKTGNIQLDDPNTINPKLYIAARARVQDYDVNLLLQGSASKPDLNFTSVPPLSSRDIISLLALGTTESSQARPALATTPVGSQNTGPQVSINTPLKNNPISKEIKEKTGFELQYAPSFDEQSAVQKIIIKRQFNNKFGVAASQAIGNRRTTDAEARYRLNDRMSGILSWQNRDQIDTTDKTAEKERNQIGLDLEYKFEFK